jgi:hypothetical protein
MPQQQTEAQKRLARVKARIARRAAENEKGPNQLERTQARIKRRAGAKATKVMEKAGYVAGVAKPDVKLPKSLKRTKGGAAESAGGEFWDGN